MSLTPLDKNAIRHSFDRAAHGYDQHAVLEHEIESRLLERVDYFQHQPQVILDVGCGPGTASHKLSTHFNFANVIALDWSLAMLKQAGRNNPQRTVESPRCVCADMHHLPIASNSVDLIFSNLALQWSYDLSAVFHEFRRVLKPQAMLIFTCYGPDTLKELKQAWRSVDDRQHVNDFPDMHDLGDELMAVGFREPVMDVERLTLEYPDVMSLLRELQGSGAQNIAIQRFKGMTGKSRFRSMLQAYGRFSRESRYPATYEVIYGAAFSPVEGQPVRTVDGEVATFSIDALIMR